MERFIADFCQINICTHSEQNISDKDVFINLSVIDFNPLTILPYFGKKKQVTKVIFLVKEQNVSAISTDVNGIYHMSYLTYLIEG